MSADKYTCIFSRQMETIVYISGVKTETIRKSSNSNFSSTKIEYQNNFSPISLFSIRDNTNNTFLSELEKMNFKVHEIAIL